MRRWLTPLIDWLVLIALVALGAWIASQKPFGLEAAPSGSLAGALFGGAAVLLANAINRGNQRALTTRELEQRVAKLRRLITAELRNVAAGHLDAKRLVDAAIASKMAGAAALQVPDMREYRPRPLTLTTDLVADMLLLDEGAIDAIVTLQSNLVATGVMMDAMTPGDAFWLPGAERLAKCITHVLTPTEF